MSKNERRTVGEVADLLGISVRTLHHWESRGLVSPEERSWSNYRLYSNDDVARLQRALVYRATGMALDDIARLLDSNDDASSHLRRQRGLLMAKQKELRHMVEAIDTLLEEHVADKKPSVEDVAKILGDADFPAYQAEAEQRYGQTEDWAISAKNTAGMTANDWESVSERTAAMEAKLVEAMDAGVEPGSAEANELAELHREVLSIYFPVSHSKHVLIAAGYAADARFRQYYEDRGEGMTDWLIAVIGANARAHGVDPDDASWE